MNKREELIRLYNETSKHSNYQILPSRLAEIIVQDSLHVKTRFEKERMDYICNNIDFHGKHVLDIGGNTGFFTFESYDSGADKVKYVEGNKIHSDFVRKSVELLGLFDSIQVVNEYYSFQGQSSSEQYDIVLLLNVLHHVGDDYGGSYERLDDAKRKIVDQLNSIASMTDIIIFQLGFNWMGDRNHCLFNNGTKAEMIEYITSGIDRKCRIDSIGIAEEKNGNIVYCNMDERNILRNDRMGEFLNRPLFIIKSDR